MTELIIERREPPIVIQDDAEMIAEMDEAETVHIEDAVDNQWFVLVSAGGESFEQFAQTVEEKLEGAPDAYRTFNDRQLIRIEY